jgi:streptogramin lyase
LNHPTDIFIDGANAFWIAAWHNSKIKRLDLERGLVQNICGTGNRKFEGDGGPCRDPAGMDLVSFDLPSSIVVDPAGNVFLSDQSNQVIRRIGLDGIVKTVAGHCPGTPGFGCPKGRGYVGDGGPATVAELNNNIGQGTGPHGKIALDSQGNLYIADTINNAVRKVSPGPDGVLGDGDSVDEIMSTVAGTGEAGYAGDGELATAAQLDAPTDVAVAQDGSLFIADSANGCVRKVDARGIITTVAGICGQIGDSGDGGRATEAKLRSPSGVNLDGNGGLYIADALNHRIRKVILQ